MPFHMCVLRRLVQRRRLEGGELHGWRGGRRGSLGVRSGEVGRCGCGESVVMVDSDGVGVHGEAAGF